MRALWIFLLVVMALIAGIIGGVFTNFWLFPKLAEVPVFQKYLQADSEGRTIVKLVEKEKEVVTEDDAVFSALDLNKPAIVTVVATPLSPAGAAPTTGTGFFVSADGLVVTNKRFGSGANASLQVIDHYNYVHQATLVVRDPLSDLALLKVEGDNFPVANLAADDAVRAGQRLVALGGKFGQGDNFVTTGSLSAVNRGIMLDGSAEAVSRLEGVLEIDALINKKNTGGPILDYNGQVIGLAAEVTGSGSVGYVIPAATVREVIDKYMDGQPLVRSTLGIHFQTVTPDFARLENLPVEHGARLHGSSGTLGVTIGGPAYRAGLREGDVITKLNGAEVDPKLGLMTELQKFNSGDEIEITYWRSGQEATVKVKVGESR